MTDPTYFDLPYVFAHANFNRLLADSNRLMGRHARARLLRAQAKRRRLKRSHGRIVRKAVYTP